MHQAILVDPSEMEYLNRTTPKWKTLGDALAVDLPLLRLRIRIAPIERDPRLPRHDYTSRTDIEYATPDSRHHEKDLGEAVSIWGPN